MDGILENGEEGEEMQCIPLTSLILALGNPRQEKEDGGKGGGGGGGEEGEIIKELNLKLEDVLPGNPGLDYPIYGSVFKTGFSCRNQVIF